MTEKIDRAAIWHEGRIYSVPQPGRHHDVIRLMASLGFTAGAMHHQGFLTDAGRFVNRETAAVLASRAGQIKVKTGPENLLFSEDVW